MKIDLEHLEDHQVRVTAEFDQETFEGYKHRAARKIAQSGKIPGFRPGKAPYDIIRRTYGDEAIQEQAVELLIDDQYGKVLEEAKIKPAAPGSLEKIESLDPVKLVFTVPKEPEIELGDYKSIRLAYEPKPVEEGQIDRFLKSLQQSYATTETVDRPAETGDLVYFKLKGTIPATKTAEADEYLKENSFEMIIGGSETEPDTWPFEGFSKNLEGLKAGDEKTVDHKFPKTAADEKLQGKKVSYQIKVDDVKLLSFPEINDEFAKTMGKFETLDALKDQVRADMEHRQMHDYDDEYFEQIFTKIEDASKVHYPPQVLEEESKDLIESFEKNLAAQNLDLSTYLKVRGLEHDKFVEEEIKPSAIKRIARSMILSEIAKLEKIEIKPIELQSMVTQRMEEIMRAQGDTKLPGKKAMQNLAQAVTMDTASRLYNQKTLDYLKAVATETLGEKEAEAVEEVEKPKKATKKAAAKKAEPKAETKAEGKKKSVKSEDAAEPATKKAAPRKKAVKTEKGAEEIGKENSDDK